jgi:trigger factor
MQSKLLKEEKNRVTLEITVSVVEIATALDAAYRKVIQKVNIPGFRKGHVPRHVLEAQYGKEVLYEDALDIMIPDAYFAAVKEYKLEPIDQPKLDVKEALSPEQPFVFQAEVEVLPKIKLGIYKDLDIKKDKVKVGEDKVVERLAALRERHAELVLSKKELLAKGDFGVIDFEGYIDGKPFPGGAAQAHTLEIGSNSFIPGFEEKLIGMELGSERELDVAFPADYPHAELAGKPVLFKVVLKEIKTKEYPELDDEFAKSLGKFETMAALKQDILEKLTQTAQVEAESNFAQEAVVKATENAKVELPEVLIEREIEDLLHNFQHNLTYQGLTFEQYLEYAKKTADEIKQDFRPEALKRVKTDLVMMAIAKVEGLEVSDAELNTKISDMAARYQEKDPAKLRRELEKRGRLEDIRRALLLERAADLITESAQARLAQK